MRTEKPLREKAWTEPGERMIPEMRLKQQTLILSQSWRLEVQDQFVGRTVISLKALEESAPCRSLTLCCLQPLLARRLFTPISASVTTWSPSLCVGDSVSSLLIATPVMLGLGPALLQYVLILVNYTCNHPISK